MQSVTDDRMSAVLLGDERKALDIQSRGYTLQPLLDLADVDALWMLHGQASQAGEVKHEVTALVVDLAARRHIYETICGIVGPKLVTLAPGYRILNAFFVTKKAGSTGDRLALHQDYSLVDQNENIGLSVWIPLSDVDSTNGCMRMVDFSHEFQHVSATPTNPSPYDLLRPELQANYLTDLPMACGDALLFDTRILHATEDNRTAADRVAVCLNLYPEHTAPRLHFWNARDPEILEVFEVDTAFMLALPPNCYLEDEEKTHANFIGFIDYKPRAWSLAELESKLPRAPKRVVEMVSMDEAMESARKAAAYLVGSQLPDGDFQTEFCNRGRETEDGQTVNERMFASSPFATSMVLHSLDFAGGLDPGIAAATSKGLRFLMSEMDEGGLWRCFTRSNPRRSVIPPDLDGTACISALLKEHGVAIPDNHWLFYDSRDQRGAFLTWLYKADSLRKKWLSFKTGGKAFNFTDEMWQWTKPDHVCAAVNANCLMYLGETERTRGAINFLVGRLTDGAEGQEIVFDPHRMSLYYFASRAYFKGVASLELAKEVVVARIGGQEQADGSLGDELQTGLGVCALMNFGAKAETLTKAIAYLVSTQRADGSWRRIPMCGGAPTPDPCGSAELTTGICLEALARFALPVGN